MPDPVYPDRVWVRIDVTGEGDSNFTDFIVGDIVGSHGIFSNRDVDRLATPGRLTFNILWNDDLATTDFVGCPVRILVNVGIRTKQIWYGYITSAKPDSGEWGERRIRITALDWVNVAQKTRLRGVELQTNIRADEAIIEALQLTPNRPAYLSLEEGFETFGFVFDGASNKTTVYAELDRITKSEPGYLYLRFRDHNLGEVLCFENVFHRGVHQPLKELPVDITSKFNIKWSNSDTGGYLYWRNPDDDGLIPLYDTTTRRAVFDKTMVSSDWRDGENVINQMSVTNIPRGVDSGDVLLYSLDKPVPLGTGEKRNFTSNYRNPDGGALIQAFDIATPTIGVDVVLNSKEDGTGSNLSSNLLMAFDPGVNAFGATLLNRGDPGYITRFEILGKGIYKYHPIETIFDNTKSKEQTVRTEVNASMTREYSSDYRISEYIARHVVGVNWAPLKLMQTADFIANYSLENMIAFLYCDIGDKVQIAESRPDHTGNYYIQGIKFVIRQGSIIEYSWSLKEGLETICEPVVVNGPSIVANDALDFGILPYLANMEEFTYSMWVRINTTAPLCFLLTRTVDNGTGRRGNHLLLLNDGKIEFMSYKTPTDGQWQTTNPVVTNVGQWYHVALRYINTTDAANPVISINGSSVVPVVVNSPSGTSDDDSDCPLILFNNAMDPNQPDPPYSDIAEPVSLKNVRIYNRRLTNNEIFDLAAKPDDYTNILDGCQFLGLFSPTWSRDEFINDTLDEDDLVLEIARGAVGKPFNEDPSDPDKMLSGEEP